MNILLPFPFDCNVFDIARFISLFQVVSPFSPSDKMRISSVQREVEEIVDMKEMKMDWVPYIPYGKRYLLFIFLIGSNYSY